MGAQVRFPLELPPGIVSNETDYAASGVFVDGNNMRPWRGRMETIGGYTKVIADALSGICRNAIAWTNNAGQQNIAFGTTTTLEVLIGSTLYDITPSGLLAGNEDTSVSGPGWGTGSWGSGGWGGGVLAEYYARTWALDTWGENLAAAPRGGTLYIWANDTGTPAAAVANAPDNIFYMLVTPERQILAFGCQEEASGTFNPMCIRGCDIGDYTDWTTTSSNNAFEYILSGGGRIVAVKLFGQFVAVWTDTAVWLGQYTSDTTNPYRFDLVADNAGLLAPNAVVVVNQTAYWITPDFQFYTWSLGNVPQPLPCPISRDFQDNIDTVQIEKVAAVSVSEFNEIWWFYADTRDGDEDSRYIAVSLSDNAWFRGQIARTAAIDSGPQQYPVFVDDSNYIYYHENGNDANGSALSWFIQTGDIELANSRVLLTGIRPDFKDQTGDVSLTIDAKSYPSDTATSYGKWTLAAGRAKQDFFVETRLAAFRFSGSAAGTYARLGRPLIDYEETGEY